jgi:hypothetical protein
MFCNDAFSSRQGIGSRKGLNREARNRLVGRNHVTIINRGEFQVSVADFAPVSNKPTCL